MSYVRHVNKQFAVKNISNENGINIAEHLPAFLYQCYLFCCHDYYFSERLTCSKFRRSGLNREFKWSKRSKFQLNRYHFAFQGPECDNQAASAVYSAALIMAVANVE